MVTCRLDYRLASISAAVVFFAGILSRWGYLPDAARNVFRSRWWCIRQLRWLCNFLGAELKDDPVAIRNVSRKG
ncbi:hypothetical protein ACNKHO_27115 [Shigella flexneri]